MGGDDLGLRPASWRPWEDLFASPTSRPRAARPTRRKSSRPAPRPTPHSMRCPTGCPKRRPMGCPETHSVAVRTLSPRWPARVRPGSTGFSSSTRSPSTSGSWPPRERLASCWTRCRAATRPAWIFGCAPTSSASRRATRRGRSAPKPTFALRATPSTAGSSSATPPLGPSLGPSLMRRDLSPKRREIRYLDGSSRIGGAVRI